ncbi:hypothetical protein [Cellulophaga tyrosinoxydans]|uniref:Uncharacterized protein n=1 Tax=Cellulophaga tyrosinoxydans TaxID=504486 RepID=A0A1W1Z6T1_9FLAO|nr:hypothetical protein [Cellulophaga tyrosinoxydans]SMC43841.1 hypothetical protein SAMN05660703_1198 [Cellulophaga tyrosinoxydans]
MKHLFIFLLVAFSSAITYGQDNANEVKIGDMFLISETHGDHYNHIKFPRKNHIFKRGAIADFKRLNGLKLVVTSITTDSNYKTMVTLKRHDGKPFFRFFPSVEAHLEKALEAKELLTISKSS